MDAGKAETVRQRVATAGGAGVGVGARLPYAVSVNLASGRYHAVVGVYAARDGSVTGTAVGDVQAGSESGLRSVSVADVAAREIAAGVHVGRPARAVATLARAEACVEAAFVAAALAQARLDGFVGGTAGEHACARVFVARGWHAERMGGNLAAWRRTGTDGSYEIAFYAPDGGMPENLDEEVDVWTYEAGEDGDRRRDVDVPLATTDYRSVREYAAAHPVPGEPPLE